MKPLITTLAFLCLAFFACKKENKTNPSNSINGKWTQTKAVNQEIVNNSAQAPIEDVLTDPNNFVQFNSDQTGTLSFGSSGTYTVTPFHYVLSGMVLTVSTTGNTETDTVKTLTPNSLIIRSVQDFESNGMHYRDITDDYYSR